MEEAKLPAHHLNYRQYFISPEKYFDAASITRRPMPRPAMMKEIRERVERTLSGLSEISKLEVLLQELPELLPLLKDLLSRNKLFRGRGKRRGEDKRNSGAFEED